MEYIIKSKSYRLLKNKIKELTIDIDENNILDFDLAFDNIKDVVEECNKISLFNEKKAIIVYNTNIFNTKYEYKDDLAILENYLNNPNIYTTLIFIADSVSIRKKCVKIIKDNNNLIEIEELKEEDLESTIKKYLKDNNFNIEYNALKKIISNLNNNIDLILNELDKLLVVKKDNTITLDDIDKYTTKLNDENVFDIVEAVIKKNKKKVFSYLDNFILNKEEPAILLSNIAIQYRLIYCTKKLTLNHKDSKEIATLLDVHPYRVKLALENSKLYTLDELKDNILKIGNLDEQIKLGKIDNYIALKMFLITL